MHKHRSCTAIGIYIFITIFTVLWQPATAQETGNALLWEVSGNGLEEPSYLFGTIHILCPDQFSLDERVKDALGKTNRTMLEMDMDEPSFGQQMQSMAVDPNRRNITSELSDREFEIVNSYLQSNYGMTLNQVEMLRPFMVLSMVIAKLPDCEQPISFENKFIELSKRSGAEIIGLESVEEQFSIFDEIDYEEQVDWIVDYISDRVEAKKLFDDMSDAYRRGDINALHDYVVNSPELEEFADLILYDRNRRWIERIEEAIRKEPTFIAFGAGHLASQNGIIHLLKKKGYTVRPMMN